MLLRLPLLSLLLVILALLMVIPMVLGAYQSDWRSGRSFLYSIIFVLTIAGILGLTATPRPQVSAQRELALLVLSWLILPVFAAIPVTMITPAIGPVGAWFEMVASLSTTGGSIYVNLASVPDAVHLWRGLMGWYGGLITLVAAYAILAPRRLGGFEVGGTIARDVGVRSEQVVALGAATPSLSRRLVRAIRVVLPIYAGLTAALALIFHLLGQGGLLSTVHAMSILATSGISPVAGGLASTDSFVAEAFAAVFLVIAAVRVFYGNASEGGQRRGKWFEDPELRLLLGLVALATLILFGRHWVGALTIDVEEPVTDVFAALWGNIFTVLSFLTTTGFESASWTTARDWSGLANPGLVLLGFCAVGGGAATTAGGIKLIRAYALIRHGFRELERIAQPNSIIGVGASMRGIMRRGAVIAWTFVMLFFMALLLTVLGLTATGMGFQNALLAATAALSNTGPVLTIVSEEALRFADLTDPARVVLALAMIAGRIEVLALIALANLDTWRRNENATIKHW
ncbi:MAG: potassium transporter TrkG [Pseudomonadota bacterium]